MTTVQKDKVARRKLSLLQLAQELGNVSKACKIVGRHPHPEGFIAFLDNDAGGIEIEFMQVYTPEQLKEYEDYKGI